MKLCTETITVWNRRTENRDDVFYPTVISGVSWHSQIISKIDEGLKAASQATLRIPADADCHGKTFVSAHDYPEADPEKVFTFRPGDKVTKGLEASGKLTAAEIKKQADEMITILGVTDNRRAYNRHWKVVGT